MSAVHSRERVGLVLSGGGGKGAYEVGCWQALRELGIPVHAVAGTSVGALNAALVAQGDPDAACSLWARITAKDVFTFRTARFPALGLRLLLLPGLLYYRTSSPSRRSVHSLFLGAAIFSLLVVGVPAIAISLASGYSDWADVRALLLWYGSLLVVVGIPIAGWFWMERRNLFVLDNRPLEATIAEFLDAERVSRSGVDTFVTAAKPIEYFDPENPSYEIDDVNGIYYHPYMSREYLPAYSRLNGKSADVIVQLLLGSTSLPFGIFPNRQASDAGWLDGGLADNTPVVPLLELGCDPIVVIHLDHRLARRDPAALDEIVGARAAALRRKLDIADDSEDSFRRFVDRHGSRIWDWDWPDLPKGPRPVVPLPRLLHVVPSRPLGGLLRGTLRFSPRRAKWLTRLGYEDAMSALVKGVAEEPARHPLRRLVRAAALVALALGALLGLALLVNLIARTESMREGSAIPFLVGLGSVMIAVGSACLWLGALWGSLADRFRNVLLGAGVVIWLAGLLVAIHGMEGAILGLVVFDLLLAGALLAVAGRAILSSVRLRRSGPPQTWAWPLVSPKSRKRPR